MRGGSQHPLSLEFSALPDFSQYTDIILMSRVIDLVFDA